jgi:protein-disulfide isomerase
MNLEERTKYAKMKARHKNVTKPWYLKPWGILSLLLIAIIIALVIASSIYIVKTAKEYNKLEAEKAQMNLKRQFEQAVIGDANNKNFGNPKAPLTIVQFSDFACPVCAQGLQTILDIKELYPEDIYFVHRDLPTQTNSIELASATHCAGEQNMFWQFYEELFRQQNRFTQLKEDDLYLELTILAGEMDINETLFAECLAEDRYLHIVSNDYGDADFLGVEGTPTWFLNNNMITGHIPHSSFILLINEILTDLK